MQKMAYPVIIPDDALKSDPTLTIVSDIVSITIMKTFNLLKDNMHYILFGLLLNPVLFLHMFNCLLTYTRESRKMPNMISSYIEPHIDINNNPSHATIFILFIVFAQWQAIQRCLSGPTGSRAVLEDNS